MSTLIEWECPKCHRANSDHVHASNCNGPLHCGSCDYSWDKDISDEHGHPGEPCIYRGMDMWSCGHVDNDMTKP